MAVAIVHRGWLFFRQLDYGGAVDGAFTIGYRLLDDQNELWSRRFLRAKDGLQPSMEAAKALLATAISELFATSRVSADDITFTPAVRSRESTASPSGTLAILAQQCATAGGCRFAPQLIRKEPHESLHSPPKSVPRRMEILEAANFRSQKVATSRVIVVDDLITSGLTLSYSAKAIKALNPNVRVFGLAWVNTSICAILEKTIMILPTDTFPTNGTSSGRPTTGGELMTRDPSSLNEAQLLLSLMRLRGMKSRRALELFEASANDPDGMSLGHLFQSIAEEWSGDSSVHELTWKQVGRQLQKTCDAEIQILPFHSPDYPDRLRNIGDPPVVLFAKGTIAALHAPASIAIVGTREPTSIGERAAERAGGIAAQAGVAVVSGLALGCDTWAHQGCVDAHGIGVAVLANALNRVYPAKNTTLADRLLEHGGCLVSENPVGARLSRWDFAYRDRLQSGLADRVLVIETDVKGGTMHTVKYSRQQHRPLGCIDHPDQFLSSPKTRGNQMLIQKGTASGISDHEALRIFIGGAALPGNREAPDTEQHMGLLSLDERVEVITDAEEKSTPLSDLSSERDRYKALSSSKPADGATQGKQLPMTLGENQC